LTAARISRASPALETTPKLAAPKILPGSAKTVVKHGFLLQRNVEARKTGAGAARTWLL
jgi:hypothetical protein